MKLRITILKYHSWYLCQISLQIMLLPIQISCSCNFCGSYYGCCLTCPIRQMLVIFSGVELNFKRLYQISGKEKESCYLVFTSSTKREIRHFHVAVVQRRQRNVQKSDARPKLLFCQSKPIAFLPFSLPSPVVVA